MYLTMENQIVPEFTELEWRLALSRARTPKSQAPSVRTGDDRATPDTIAPERLRLASAGIKYLSAIIQQLVELRKEAESDEYGTLRASQHAFDIACHLVTDAAIISACDGRQIPRGCTSTDSQGGVRIEWVRPTASVHLVIPASSNHAPYIYHEVADCHATEPASPDRLASRLIAVG
jgi:hypothetical protein